MAETDELTLTADDGSSVKDRIKQLQQAKQEKFQKTIADSVLGLWDVEPVTRVLADWGEEPEIGHSIYRRGVLSKFQSSEVQLLADEIKETVQQARAVTFNEEELDRMVSDAKEKLQSDPSEADLNFTGSNISSHRRAATLSLAWSKPTELKNQVASEVTIFKEALNRMKQNVSELNTEKQDQKNALQVLEAMVNDMEDHMSATEEELQQRDVVIADLNAELETYKRKAAAGADSGADGSEKSKNTPKKALVKEGTTIGEWLGEYNTVGESIDQKIVDKIRNREARRFGIMLAAMQEQMDYERERFIMALKEKEAAIHRMKNDTFKKNLDVLCENWWPLN